MRIHPAFVLLTIALCSCVGPHVRSPRSDVPFGYSVGWWPYQDKLSVKRIEAKPLDSRLNLFNAKTLAEVIITGEISGNKGWRPNITKAHLSELVIRGRNFAGYEAEIRITPIINVSKDKSYNSEPIPFQIKQELILNSMGWGENTFKIVCGPLSQNLVVHQRK